VKSRFRSRPALSACLLAIIGGGGVVSPFARAEEAPEAKDAARPPLALAGLENPVWQRPHGVRDPGVLPTKDGYRLFYTRPAGRSWGDPENWSVACVFTPDFRTFREEDDVTPKGYASPDAPTVWHGRSILPYQRYPIDPVLCYSASTDGKTWSAPTAFLKEVVDLPWNTLRRVIDPTFVVDGPALHCFFVGSCPAEKKGAHANLLGRAVTTDPELKRWKILTPERPLLGITADAPDGVENVTVFKTGSVWTMIYSEGLQRQHLAYGTSTDLVQWTWKGRIGVPVQGWMHRCCGAPFVWREPDRWLMILMGLNARDVPSFGLLHSADGHAWTLLPECRTK
jgi:hypothetical protein